MKNLEKAVLDLLHSCARTGNWNPDEDNKSIQNVMELIRNVPRIRKYWEFDCAYGTIIYAIKQYSGVSPLSYDKTSANHIINLVAEGLYKQSGIHWLIVPVENAYLSKYIKFNQFAFIPSTFDKESKVRAISKLVGISFSRAFEDATRTERSRSPAFFNHPLMCIRYRHQTEIVRFRSEDIVLWNISALKAIYYAYTDIKKYGVPLLYNIGFEENKIEHLAIYTKEKWRAGHTPLHFNLSCKFSLDWLENVNCQQKLVELNNKLILPSRLDPLAYRFYRALRFFSSAINIRENRERFEGLGLTVLYLMIAAESILLDQDGEKRARLTALLPRVTCLPGFSLREQAEAIDKVYRWRSDFVHAGNDTFPEYDEEFNEGEPQKVVEIVMKMVAKVVVDAPFHLSSINKQLGINETEALKTNTRSLQWFKNLREIWFTGLCGGKK